MSSGKRHNSTAKKEHALTPHAAISQKRFLAAYAECAMISEAAKKADICRDSHYKWLADPEYRKAFEEAKRAVCDKVDDEIIRRGMHGTSDVLLIFAAKALMPDKYRENYKLDVTAGVTVKRNPHLAKLTDEQLRILEQWHNAAAAASNGSGHVH